MSTETPSFADVIAAFIAANRAGLHVSVPARVTSYDAVTKTVTVEPMTKKVERGPDGERISEPLGVLSGVPVAFPRGGTYFLHMPLEAGDGGHLIFTDTNMGSWRDTGLVSDPGDERRHGLGGAVFYPGLETVARTLTEDADHLVLGKEGGPTIHINDDTVQLGAAGGDFVLKGHSLVLAWLDIVGGATGAGAFPTLEGVADKVKAT